MKENIKTFKPLKIDFNIYFLGNEEEQEEADAKQASRAAELEAIIFSSDFIAAEYTTPNGSRRILHHSTRPGVVFQLSYIAADGVPVMHENFIKEESTTPERGKTESAAALLEHFTLESNENPLTLHFLTA